MYFIYFIHSLFFGHESSWIYHPKNSTMEADTKGSLLGTYHMCLKCFHWYQLPSWNFPNSNGEVTKSSEPLSSHEIVLTKRSVLDQSHPALPGKSKSSSTWRFHLRSTTQTSTRRQFALSLLFLPKPRLKNIHLFCELAMERIYCLDDLNFDFFALWLVDV